MSELSLDKFSSEAKSVVGRAQSLADKRKHKEVEPIHFLSVVLGSPEAVKLLSPNADLKVAESLVEAQLQGMARGAYDQSYLSNDMINLLRRAERQAGKNNVRLEHLMSALSEDQKDSSMKVLQSLGLSSKDKAKKDLKKDEVASIPYLNNITNLARAGSLDPVIGRNNEVRRLIQILGRRGKSHPILVGNTGVGKRSIVNALAMKITSGSVSSKFSTVNVIHLDAGRLISGVKQRGDVEERVKKALSTIRPENTILYIHGIDSLFSQNTALSGSADLISSLLAQENLRLITSTTPDGYKKLVEKDAALMHQFTLINVEPATDAEAIEILRGVAVKYETYHKVKIGEPAITSAVKLAKRYLQKRALPDSAIDLLDEAASRKKFEVDGLPAKSDGMLARFSSLKAQLVGLAGDEDKYSLKSKSLIEREIEELSPTAEDIIATMKRNRCAAHNIDCVLSEEDIAAVLEDWTGIPLAKMLEGESDKLNKMEDIITKRVVGQDEAVKAIAKAVRRSRLGLRDLGKPIGSFLFLGSSGVGKTEIAKALAQFLFDSDKSMVRIDCSELQQSHTVQRLLGAPPGYAQAEEGGMLTEAISKDPFSVILFDEVEKGHPDVFSILLQVLDDGRLTDGRGKTVDFTNTVVIMTSNIGSLKLLETPKSQFESEEGLAQIKAELQSDLTKHLRPEFLNRIDNTVIFTPLTKETLMGIADIQIRVVEKMLSSREIKLTITDEAKSFLVNEDYNASFGARPLKRSILRNVQDVLGERIMNGITKDGSTVNISLKGGALFFKEI